MFLPTDCLVLLLIIPVAEPLGGGGEGGFDLLALPAFLPSVISCLFTQNKWREGRGDGH